MKTLGERILERMEALELTQDQVVAKLKQLTPNGKGSQGLISQLINGANENSKYLPEIAAVLKTSRDWLLYGKDGIHDKSDPTPQAHSLIMATADGFLIPQYDAVGTMGDGAYNENVGIIRSLLVSHEWLKVNIPHCTSYKNLAVITGSGDSMKGIFNHGDPVIIDTGVNEANYDGLYHFTIESRSYIKRLQLIPAIGLRVKSTNPDYDDWDILDCTGLIVHGKVLKAWEGRNF